MKGLLVGLAASVLAACASSAGPKAGAAPPASETPAGVYGGAPLVRLADGRLLWSSGDLASGEGRAQIAPANVSLRQVARYGEGVVACGLVEMRSTYLRGGTGKLACRHYGAAGWREVFRKPLGAYAQTGGILVQGDTLFLSFLSEEVWAVDLRTGRRIGRREVGGLHTGRVYLLPGVYTAAGPSRGAGEIALIRTDAGPVAARLVSDAEGVRVLSQRLLLTRRGFELGELMETRVSDAAMPLAYDGLILKGLDANGLLWRFAHLESGPRRYGVIELAGFPTRATLLWSGTLASEQEVAAKHVAATGRRLAVSFGPAQGPASVGLVNLDGEPGLRTTERPTAECAREAASAHHTFVVDDGRGGLEVVTEWRAKRGPRCWTSERLS